MKRIGVVVLLVLGLFLVPGPVATDEVLAADAAAQTEEQELEEYVPSQKVSADASISFPVDI